MQKRNETVILADQLKLSQPGGTDYAYLSLLVLLINTDTPGFSDLPMTLKSCSAVRYFIQMLMTKRRCQI